MQLVDSQIGTFIVQLCGITKINEDGLKISQYD